MNRQSTVTCYTLQHLVSAYTFPEEALIKDVDIDDQYIRIEFTDGRLLAIPLHWIPSVHHATPEDRAKFKISRSRTMIIWDPDEGSINEELRVSDYLGPPVAPTA